jgi:predicted hydrocarbon binding protein
MNRKEFINSLCKFGICSCAGIGLFAYDKVKAKESEEIEKLKGRFKFTQYRIAKLIEIMYSTLDEKTYQEILEKVGRECGKVFGVYLKYRGNIEGYIDEVARQWYKEVKYDQKEGIIKIISDKREDCVCSLATKEFTPHTFCDCSAGLFKEIYETVLENSVNVDVIESVLSGAERCVFKIRMT